MFNYNHLLQNWSELLADVNSLLSAMLFICLSPWLVDYCENNRPN